MVSNTKSTPSYSLSALIFEGIQANAENAADMFLSRHLYEEALSAYNQLDISIPGVAAKLAYCEWRTHHYDDAKSRLVGLGEALDADGIGLLSKLISVDKNDERRDAHKKLVWPRLKATISSSSVPLIAALARCQTMWPDDYQNPNQRLQDNKHLLSLHPNCQQLRLAVLADLRRTHASVDEQYKLLHAREYSAPHPQYLLALARVAADSGRFDEALNYLIQTSEHEQLSEQQVSFLRRCTESPGVRAVLFREKINIFPLDDPVFEA